MKVLLVIWIFAVTGIVANCEQPKIPQATTVDFSLYAAVMTTRVLDYVSTERVLDSGGKEDILPSGLVHNKPAFALYSIGTGAAEIFISHLLLKRNHRKMARILLMTDVSFTGAVVAHNFAQVKPVSK